jgi:hypothetical protein
LSGDNFWKYDEETIKLVLTAFSYKEELEIINPYLNDNFKVYKVAITDIKVAQSSEFSNVVAYEINCLAVLDTDIFTLQTQ